MSHRCEDAKKKTPEHCYSERSYTSGAIRTRHYRSVIVATVRGEDFVTN